MPVQNPEGLKPAISKDLQTLGDNLLTNIADVTTDIFDAYLVLKYMQVQIETKIELSIANQIAINEVMGE